MALCCTMGQRLDIFSWRRCFLVENRGFFQPNPRYDLTPFIGDFFHRVPSWLWGDGTAEVGVFVEVLGKGSSLGGEGTSTCQEPVYAGDQVGIRRFDDRVEMVAHEAIRMHLFTP
jgi:hypothetical protein